MESGSKIPHAQSPKAKEGYEKVFDFDIDNVKYLKIGPVEGPETYTLADAIEMRKDKRKSPKDFMPDRSSPPPRCRI